MDVNLRARESPAGTRRPSQHPAEACRCRGPAAGQWEPGTPGPAARQSRASVPRPPWVPNAVNCFDGPRARGGKTNYSERVGVKSVGAASRAGLQSGVAQSRRRRTTSPSA